MEEERTDVHGHNYVTTEAGSGSMWSQTERRLEPPGDQGRCPQSPGEGHSLSMPGFWVPVPNTSGVDLS